MIRELEEFYRADAMCRGSHPQHTKHSLAAMSTPQLAQLHKEIYLEESIVDTTDVFTPDDENLRKRSRTSRRH
jgi:hypothetical protein